MTESAIYIINDKLTQDLLDQQGQVWASEAQSRRNQTSYVPARADQSITHASSAGSSPFMKDRNTNVKVIAVQLVEVVEAR